MKRTSVLVIFILYFLLASAGTDRQISLGFIHQSRLSEHWGIWLDLHHRTRNDFLKNLHMEITRFGATYFINTNWRVTLGYAFVAQFPSNSNQSFVRPEHRPWQQIFYIYKKKNITLIQYLRNEQRFMHKTQGEHLADGYVFRERIRYNAMFTVLFNNKEFKQGSVGFTVADEVFCNAYSSDKVRAFDQNRAFAGLCCNITDELQLQLGYQNVFSFTAAGNDIAHSIRLYAFHNLDLRKKKK